MGDVFKRADEVSIDSNIDFYHLYINYVRLASILGILCFKWNLLGWNLAAFVFHAPMMERLRYETDRKASLFHKRDQKDGRLVQDRIGGVIHHRRLHLDLSKSEGIRI